MRALSAVMLVGCVGGSSGLPVTPLVSDGLLAGVSADEQSLAYFTDPQNVTDSVAGRLWVKSIATADPPISLDQDAPWPLFTPAGDVLIYGVDPGLQNQGRQFWPKMWRPGLARGVPIGSDQIGRYQLIYNSTTVFLESGATDGRVARAALDDCTSDECPVTVLGEHVHRYAVSSGGKRVVFETVDPEKGEAQFWWYDSATDRSTSVGSVDLVRAEAATRPLSITAGGERIAIMDAASGVAVLDTSTLSAVAWAALPDGAAVSELYFLDADTVLVLAVDDQGSALYRTTASSAERWVSAVSFEPIWTAGHGTTGLFFSTALPDANGARPITMLDFGSGATLDVSPAALAFPQLSEDGQVAQFPETGNAEFNLAAVDMAKRARVEIAPVYYNGGWFVPGGHDVLFVGDNGAVDRWTLDGSVTAVLAYVINWMPTRSRKLYFTAGAWPALSGEIGVLPIGPER